MPTWMIATLVFFFHSSISQTTFASHANSTLSNLHNDFPQNSLRPLGYGSQATGNPDEQQRWPNMSVEDLKRLQEKLRFRLQVHGDETGDLEGQLNLLNEYIGSRTRNLSAVGVSDEKEDPRIKWLPQDGLSGDEILNKGLIANGFTKEKLSPEQQKALRSLAYSDVKDGTFSKKIGKIIKEGHFTAQELEKIYREASKVSNPHENRSYRSRADWINQNFLASPENNFQNAPQQPKTTGQNYSQTSFRTRTTQKGTWRRRLWVKRSRRF